MCEDNKCKDHALKKKKRIKFKAKIKLKVLITMTRIKVDELMIKQVHIDEREIIAVIDTGAM